MHLMYAAYPTYMPDREEEILWMAGVSLMLLGGIWRLGLRRRPLTFAQLHAIDLFYAGGSGVVLGSSAYLARDFTPSGYGCLIYASSMVLLRAIIEPSTTARTALTASILCTPMVLAS